MLSFRRQLPVYSPIRFGSLMAGLGAAVGLGRPRDRLRSRLTNDYGAAGLILTDSGTTALRLAIAGALEEAGGEIVALPAYCCYDVVTAAVGAGARVRLYDVDAATLGPEWRSLEEALGADVAAVVAVHLYGIPVDVDRVAKLAAAHGALVIDDAAQGFGGSIGGRPLGTFGSLGVLSFGRGKGVTGGGGGAVLANDEAGRRVLDRVRDLPARGRLGWAEIAKLSAQWFLGRPSVYGLPASIPWLGLGETRYEEPWPPRGISRGGAAALLANWDVSLMEAAARREGAEKLHVGLADTVTMPESAAPGAKPGMLRQPLMREDAEGESVGQGGARRAGLQRGYPDLQAIPALGPVLRGGGPWPGAAQLVAALWTAPTHSRSVPSATVATVRDLLEG